VPFSEFIVLKFNTGGVGTRPDVSMLLRDSQYVVETITDAQINSVVSGALDRLHSEKDPCVRFDSEQKLWMYPTQAIASS
jgi:nuclear factor related to kappa-B-binding protein